MSVQTFVVAYHGGVSLRLFGWEISIRRVDKRGSLEEIEEMIDDE